MNFSLVTVLGFRAKAGGVGGEGRAGIGVHITMTPFAYLPLLFIFAEMWMHEVQNELKSIEDDDNDNDEKTQSEETLW